MVFLFHIFISHCFMLCLRGVFVTLEIVTEWIGYLENLNDIPVIIYCLKF